MGIIKQLPPQLYQDIGTILIPKGGSVPITHDNVMVCNKIITESTRRSRGECVDALQTGANHRLASLTE